MDDSIYQFIEFNTFKKKNKISNNFIDITKINKTNDLYIYVDTYKPNKKIKLLDGVCESIYYIDLNYYLQDILKSYSNDNERILKQFHLDFDRLCIYINNNKVNNCNELIDYFSYSHKTELYTLLMILTQANMGLPFEIIQKSLEENVFLGERNKKYQNAMKIYVTSINNELKIKIKKKLRLFKIINGDAITIKVIYIKLYINLKDDFLLFKII